MKSHIIHTTYSIILSSFIAAANLICAAAETSSAASENKQIAAEEVEVIQLEKLPKTTGGWTFAPKGEWAPLTVEDAAGLLSVKLQGACNTGNGWVAGIGFKLRKPIAMERIIVHRGWQGWVDLETIVIYCSDAEGGKELDVKDWVEVKRVEPDEWPEEGKIQIPIDDTKPHRWWGLCFVPPMGQKSGSINISGIRLFAK